MPDPDIAKLADLAEGLSEEGRELLLFFPAGSTIPAYAARIDHDGRKAARIIKRTGLFEKVDMKHYGSPTWWYRLTPLGLQVRKHLQGEQG